jgi:hypothetical protein
MANDLVQIEVSLDTRQKIKVLASLEAQTTPEWVEWMVNKAFEAKRIGYEKSKSKRS